MAKKHYDKSASATSRWLNCNQSIKLSRGIPRKESSYSREGTAAHDVAEQCLTEGMAADQVAEDSEVAEAVQEYVDEIAKWRDAKQPLIEQTEKTMVCVGVNDFGGTSDHFMVYQEDGEIVLHCFDYKHGAGVIVDAEENLQVLSYFAIIGSHYPGMISKFRATIVQPRAYSGDRNTTWECDAARVEAHLAAVEAVDPENGSWEVGEWCRWCPATTICQKLSDEAMRVAEESFEVIREDSDRLLELRQKAPAIKALLDKIEDALVDRFRLGQPIPGMKVVKKLGNRSWSLSDEELAKLFKQLRIPKRAYIKKTESFLSPTQLLREVDKSKVDALEQVIERKETGFKVVAESDKGEPYVFTSLEDQFEGF